MLSSAGIGGLLEKTLPFHHFISNPITNPNNTNKISKFFQPPKPNQNIFKIRHKSSFILCCSTEDSATTTATPPLTEDSATTTTPPPLTEDSTTPSPLTEDSATATTTTTRAPRGRKKSTHRKLCPGETEGIVEEMRFVQMKFRNVKRRTRRRHSTPDIEESNKIIGVEETWQPSMDGFLKYLVDSKLVFETLEGIVDNFDDISYTHFRKTGLERSEGLSKDLEWFRQQDIVIPEPSSPGVSYAGYLEQVAETSAPLLLCHFYNIHFAHISGGQVIAKQVSEKLLSGRELELCKWEGDPLELLKDVRDNLNMLGMDWPRDKKNKCLTETTKSFRFLGQIVRLIIFL